MNRVLYHEWFPQILYNHHQSGPAGTVFWSPPFRDPFNYNQDPLLVLGLQTARDSRMHTRLAAEGKPGATVRSRRRRTTAGGTAASATPRRSTTSIAILTEMIGSPTPMRIPLVMQRQLPTSDLTFPVPPQEWHFRQSIDYSVTANRARARYRVALIARRCCSTAIGWAGTRSSAAAATRGRRRRIATRRWRRRWACPMAGGGRGGGAATPERDEARAGRRCTSPSSRSARLHHPVEPAGFPDRDEVHQRAARSRHQRAARDARLHGAGQEVSRRLVRRDDARRRSGRT